MNLSKLSICISLFLFSCLSWSAINAQTTTSPIPIYALPYYNYEPLTITVGKYKNELLTKDSAQMIMLANQIKNDINNTDIESLYILSIRLYDLGKKDDAFYWFHTAKSRARIFINMLDPKKIGSVGSRPFELKQLFLSFNATVGEYMNGYGFNDIDKGIAVIERVKNEVKEIQSYKDVYKNINFLDDSNLNSEKLKKEKELGELIAYVGSHREEIKKQREAAGMQNKY